MITSIEVKRFFPGKGANNIGPFTSEYLRGGPPAANQFFSGNRANNIGPFTSDYFQGKGANIGAFTSTFVNHAFKLERQKHPPEGGLVKARGKGTNDIEIPRGRSLRRDPGEIPPELPGALYTSNYVGIAIPAPGAGKCYCY